MTDKELRKLSRSELLEILYYLRKEVEDLRTENEQLKARIDGMTNAAASGETKLSEESMSILMVNLGQVIKDHLSGKAPPGKETVPEEPAG